MAPQGTQGAGGAPASKEDGEPGAWLALLCMLRGKRAGGWDPGGDWLFGLACAGCIAVALSPWLITLAVVGWDRFFSPRNASQKNIVLADTATNTPETMKGELKVVHAAGPASSGASGGESQQGSNGQASFGGSSSAAVPEPASLSIFALGCLAILRRRRRGC